MQRRGEETLLELIKGITFAPFARRGTFRDPAAGRSLRTMRERTGATHVILAPSGIQKTPYSEEIDFSGEGTLADEELAGMVSRARSLGLKVILKPTVNCENGVWRAYINFFDKETPCEPKWSRWFASHERFQLHYAELAEKTGCALFIAGCEMVMAQRREEEWRRLIGGIKQIYSGPVSYNTDKYQEETVAWWDCVDVISSSGYYPFGSWPGQLERIRKVAERYRKPFFFAEAGCMSARGAGNTPNDWMLAGPSDPEEQERWYREMFRETMRRPWVRGWGLWDWPAVLYPEPQAAGDRGYSIWGKPAESVVREAYGKG